MILRINQKWGFGLAPIKSSTQQKRDCWVSVCQKVVDDGYVEEDSLESISEVKGLFSRVVKQDQWDWFTVFLQLGSPGRIKSRQFAQNLYRVRRAFIDGDEEAVSQYIDALRKLSIAKHLHNFLCGNSYEEDSEKIYVLSTPEQPEFLLIGFTSGSIIKRVNEINQSTGVVIPYGVRAMWRVKRGHGLNIEKKIHASFSHHRIGDDREFFELSYSAAFQSINSLLRCHRNESER